MPKCQLLVKDQCNVKFQGLDPTVRRKMTEELKFRIPNAQHIPAVRLGRWDGTVSFCTMGGGTYINLLDRVLPLIRQAGYSIEVDDRRPDFSFKFPPIDDQLFASQCWPLGHALAGEPIVLRDYQVEALRTFVANAQGVQCIATAAGKCLDFDTEIDIEIDEHTAFGTFLLNTVDYQEITTDAGFYQTSDRECSATKLETGC